MPHEQEPSDHMADMALATVPGICIWDPEDTGPEDQAPPSNWPHKGPLGHTDIFVDDFIQIEQGGAK
jgi:hypothetical protein